MGSPQKRGNQIRRSRRTGARVNTNSLRKQAYADGGDRGLLCARSPRCERRKTTRLVRNWSVEPYICAAIRVMAAKSVAVCPAELHPRRQQVSVSDRGKVGVPLPPWQIVESPAMSC